MVLLLVVACHVLYAVACGGLSSEGNVLIVGCSFSVVLNANNSFRLLKCDPLLRLWNSMCWWHLKWIVCKYHVGVDVVVWLAV